MGSVLGVFRKQRSIRNLTLALVSLFAMVFGLAPWNAAFMMRSHGMGSAELGMWWGLSNGLAGLAAVWTGGYVANRWFGDNERGLMHLCAATVALSVPCYVAFLLLPEKTFALAMLAPWVFVANLFVAPVYALIQRLVPDEMRATAMAIIMLLYNFIGMGAGPQLVGFLSDCFTPTFGTDSLRYAMLIVSSVGLLSAWQFWRVGQSVERDLTIVSSRAQRLRRFTGGTCRRPAEIVDI